MNLPGIGDLESTSGELAEEATDWCSVHWYNSSIIKPHIAPPSLAAVYFFASAETTESCSVLARIALMPEPSGFVKNILCRDRGATDLRLLGRVSSSAASTSIVQRLRIWVVHRGVKTEKAGTLTLDHCFPNGFSQTHACSTHVIQQQPTGILEDSQRNQLISLQRWHNIAIRHDNDVSPVSWHITPNTAKWLLAIVKTFALESLAVLCPMLSFTAILIEELRRKMENQAKP